MSSCAFFVSYIPRIVSQLSEFKNYAPHGVEDGSASKVLAAQVWGSEFRSSALIQILGRGGGPAIIPVHRRQTETATPGAVRLARPVELVRSDFK